MEALPNTSLADSFIMGGAMLGVVLVSGIVFVLTVFRNPLGHWLRARRHRRESASHPEQECLFCGGTATKLVRHSGRQRSIMGFAKQGEVTYRCKDRELCRATRKLKKLLDSLS